MTITIPIPSPLLDQFDKFALECQGMSNKEFIIPKKTLVLEAYEALWAHVPLSTHTLCGPIYIDLRAGTLTGVTTPKRLHRA